MGESKRKKAALRSLAAMSLTEHVDDFRARAASELRRRGEVRHRLEAVTEGGEVIEIDTSYRGDRERETVCRTLPGVLRRRGVTRYLMVAEAWMSREAVERPSADPDRVEALHVIAVERGGERCNFVAEIKRQKDERPTLTEWESDEGRGWMFELFDADPDEQPAVTPVMDEDAVKSLNRATTRQFVSFMEVAEVLLEVIQRLHRPGEDWAIFGALMAFVTPLLSRGFRNGLCHHARMLRDRPDVFPITPAVEPLDKAAILACIKKHGGRYRGPIAEILHDLDEEVVFNSAMNVAVQGGVALRGGPGCADYLEGLAAETQDEAAA